MTMRRALIVCVVVPFSFIIAINAVLHLFKSKSHHPFQQGPKNGREFCHDEQGKNYSRGAERLSPNGARMIERCDADGTWKPVGR